jgi:hypothetical protein
MKKVTKAFLCATVIIGSMAGVASASTSTETITPNAIVDLAPVAQKSTVKRMAGNQSVEAVITPDAPTDTSRTDTHSPLFGGFYATSTSDSTISEDYIYAKCRTYNGDGSLLHSAEDKQYNSSHAGAKADNGSAYTGDDYAIGNHTYKEAGYLDVVHETKAYW